MMYTYIKKKKKKGKMFHSKTVPFRAPYDTSSSKSFNFVRNFIRRGHLPIFPSSNFVINLDLAKETNLDN